MKKLEKEEKEEYQLYAWNKRIFVKNVYPYCPNFQIH